MATSDVVSRTLSRLPTNCEPRMLLKLMATDLSSFARRIMDLETDRIAVGMRFKISKLGSIRCPELAGGAGVVVDVSSRTTGITVRFGGAARATVLHRDYINPEI